MDRPVVLRRSSTRLATATAAMVVAAALLLAFKSPSAVTVDAQSVEQLQYRYYRPTCKNVEKIVREEVTKAFKKDPTVAPGILRLFFHDCFVRGCDGSVLLAGPGTERTSSTNSRLHGFEAIDAVKTALEQACPGTVSCADILAYAARDAVVLTGGSSWKVFAGRRDGTVSLAVEVDQNLPPSTAKTPELIATFAQKGLTPQQMVDLSGSHTLGVTHCVHLRDRIFTPTTDPTMPKSLLQELQKVCPSIAAPAAIVMDRKSVHRFDTEYYKNIVSGNGVMTSDQDLYADESTRRFVVKNLKHSSFVHRFGKAMFALGFVEPKLAPEGEIRKRCQFVN